MKWNSETSEATDFGVMGLGDSAGSGIPNSEF